MSQHRTHVAVIGAGPAGYPAAFRAADRGFKVTLLDMRPELGGVCLHDGCIPSKALLHAADVLRAARDGRALGITFPEPDINLDALRSWKEGIVQQLSAGLRLLCQKRGIQYIRGRARFKSPTALEIEAAEGHVPTVLAFDHAIVATGSAPAALKGLDVSADRLLDAASALALRDLPRRLLVIGGGYVGLELGTVYATLGSRVTVVEMMPTLLPGADPELVRVLAKRVTRLFEAVHLGTTVAGAADKGDHVAVALQRQDGQVAEEAFDKILVAVGRKPNTGSLGLENTRVATDERGFIRVDAQRRTAEPTIFAIGDVAGEPMLAHKGTHEGLAAADVIAGEKQRFEPRAIPAVVFTDPELAWCGLGEAEARRQGLDIVVAKFPWSASGRAVTLGRPDGLTKLVLEAGTKRLVGLGIVGRGAGDLIAEGALAIEMGAKADDLSLTVHPHPTLSETIMEAAEVALGRATHVHRPR